MGAEQESCHILEQFPFKESLPREPCSTRFFKIKICKVTPTNQIKRKEREKERNYIFGHYLQTAK